MNVEAIKKLSTDNGWDFLDHQPNIGLISFSKVINDYQARINIYTTKMTVATCIKHPKKGKTQMFRKNVGKKLLGEIFENPRVHTDRGYRTKQ